MTENYYFLFQYLEREQIRIDKIEFDFQIKSHPDYPALLAISDTLSFFNIPNIAFRVDVHDFDSLPNRFVALLDDKDGYPQLCFVENINEAYFYTQEQKRISITKEALKARWKNIVLCIEKRGVDSHHENTNPQNRSMYLICIFLFGFSIYQFDSKIESTLFLLFPFIGFVFSFAALKDLFGVKSEIINNFCNITVSSGCNTLINSNKWKLFEFVSFSDLSICFFSAQFIGLLLFLFTKNAEQFFIIQQLLLFLSLPVIIASLYFQRFIEKKWCPICLAIISVILLQLIYCLLFFNFSFAISINSLLHYGMLFFTIALIWKAIKKILTSQKTLKEFETKANRFIRNYNNFKAILTAQVKIELPLTEIILGNPESKTQITIITNPFCGHCKAAHELLEKILEKHSQELHIKVIIKADLAHETTENVVIYQNLFSVFLEKGAAGFSKALNDLFNGIDVEKWLGLYPRNDNYQTKINTIYTNHFQWCIDNEFNFTPTIFVNGFEYPSSYDRNSLQFFVNELIEDDDFE